MKNILIVYSKQLLFLSLFCCAFSVQLSAIPAKDIKTIEQLQENLPGIIQISESLDDALSEIKKIQYSNLDDDPFVAALIIQSLARRFKPEINQVFMPYAQDINQVWRTNFDPLAYESYIASRWNTPGAFWYISNLLSSRPKNQPIIGIDEKTEQYVNTLKKMQPGYFRTTIIDAVKNNQNDRLALLRSELQPLPEEIRKQIANRLDAAGNTPLHNAVLGRNLQAVRILLSMQADPSIKNKQGQTPLDLAAIKGPNDLLPIFIEAGHGQLMNKR
jgi:hypothetical protein